MAIRKAHMKSGGKLAEKDTVPLSAHEQATWRRWLAESAALREALRAKGVALSEADMEDALEHRHP